MTATTSAATKNFFGKRFLTDILENKKVLIINFVLELLGLPVVSVVVLIITYLEKLQEKSEVYIDYSIMLAPFIFIGVATIVISILLGFVIALFQFNYLYRKSLVDMNYSLPLSSTQRFFSDYLSGLAIYLVPVAIAVVLSFVILTVGNVFIDIENFWSIIPHVIKSGMIVIVGMIMLYTLSVLAIVFCGSTFEAIFSIIAVNAMIPATIGCVWLAIVTTSSYGMVGSSIFYSPVFTATSPIGATVFFFMYMFEAVDMSYDGVYTSYYDSMYIRWMVVALVVTVVFLAAAFLLYKLRKAESVSKPYVYKAFFYVIGAACVFCIMSILIATGINLISAVISGIIICGIGWFIMEVIARRGFKRFWTAPLGFIAVMCGVFLICGVCRVTDGFGAPRHVPAALSVESVSISTNDRSVLPYDVAEVEFRDRDVIKAVTALNKDAVDRHFNFDKYTYNDIDKIDSEYDRYDVQFVEITYQTIYGSTVKREYSVMSFMLSDVIEAVLCSDEYAAKASEEVALEAVNNTNSGKYYGSYATAKREKAGGRLAVFNKLNSQTATVALRAESLDEFKEAYNKDLKAMTPEELREGRVYCYLPDNYWVLDSFTNTKAFLADHDIEVNEVSATDINNDSYGNNQVEIIYMPRFYSRPKAFFGESDRYSRYSYSYYYDGDDINKYSEVDAITSAFPDSDSYYGDYDLYYDTNSSEFSAKLVNEATPIIIGEKPIAIVHIGSNTCYVRDTNENRELLKLYYYGV
ncbi:MAG: hypothetical protein Q4A05_05450 [Ruminococcus sp.]|nr:hypothetical protein [Ruminococcus sp.]